MKQKRRWVSIIFLAIVLMVAVIWLVNQGPFYKGKRLDTWLQIADYGDPADAPAAKDAVRAIGTGALPRLVWLLKAQDTDVPVLYSYRDYVHTLLGRRSEQISARDLNEWGAAGFRILGSNSVPALVKLTSDERQDVRASAAKLLAEIDRNASNQVQR